MTKKVFKRNSLLPDQETVIAEIILGDAAETLRKYPDNFVDLIVTSPPYADQRKNTYGGIRPGKYVEWFLPYSEEFLRVLKPTGSFVLNIKEKVANSERHTYVIELILALREQGVVMDRRIHMVQKKLFSG